MGFKYCYFCEDKQKTGDCSNCDTRYCDDCCFCCSECRSWFCKACEHPQSCKINERTMYKRSRNGYDGDLSDYLEYTCKKCFKE